MRAYRTNVLILKEILTQKGLIFNEHYEDAGELEDVAQYIEEFYPMEFRDAVTMYIEDTLSNYPGFLVPGEFPDHHSPQCEGECPNEGDSNP